eukprot:c23165_g1_i1 orf=154-390(+)
MCQELLRPFTLTELHDAIVALDVASCLGDDGLTRDFFQTFWDDLQLPLLRRLQQIFDIGYMPQSMCSGLIALIPKGEI